VLPLVSAIYAGRHEIRSSSGRLYIHLPVKTVAGLISKRVRVVAVVNAENCEDKTLNGSMIMFNANLVRVGGTFRVNIPSYYASQMSLVSDCGKLDVWIVPI